MTPSTYSKGLEGIIAGESAICLIDGQKGKLSYLGYSVDELAEKSSFEETTYLLLHGRLPNRAEMAEFSARMRAQRALTPEVLEMIRAFPEAAHPMELLQSVVSYLGSYVQHKIHHSTSCDCRRTLHQVAQMATVIAAWQRFHEGKDPVAPREDLSHGANFLYMLRGTPPDELEGRIFESCLVLHAEHGFNASTFTARVVASTMSTCYCSISAAIGALFGSLHGGANERVMQMVDAIGDSSRAKQWTADALARKAKIMGMGHREYKVKDPRSYLMETYLEALSKAKNDTRYYDILKAVESSFHERMEEKGKPLYPNVDFFSGAVYRLLGIPSVLFTPVFAMARVAGWLAHVLEQRVDNRLYRPESLYTGTSARKYISLEER